MRETEHEVRHEVNCGLNDCIQYFTRSLLKCPNEWIKGENVGDEKNACNNRVWCYFSKSKFLFTYFVTIITAHSNLSTQPILIKSVPKTKKRRSQNEKNSGTAKSQVWLKTFSQKFNHSKKRRERKHKLNLFFVWKRIISLLLPCGRVCACALSSAHSKYSSRKKRKIPIRAKQ